MEYSKKTPRGIIKEHNHKVYSVGVGGGEGGGQ